MSLNVIAYPPLVRPSRFPAVQALPPLAAQAPAANANAVLTLPAIPAQAPGDPTAGWAWYIGWLGWSYIGGTVTGSLTIVWTDATANAAGSVTETYAINSQGFGQTNWFMPRRFGNGNSQVVVTLTAGGSGVTGTLYAQAWTDY